MRKLVNILLVAFFSFFSFCIGIIFFVLHYSWIDFSPLEYRDQGQATIVLDDQGNEWARFCLDRRQPVCYEKFPPHLIQAFLAAEDHAFFSHYGLSIKGIVRSIFINLYHGKIVQGASTITQQLVKLLYTDCKRTFSRKIKDQLLALLVERYYTKEQILQTYLNNVFFGCGIYGVQAASQRFWSKDVQQVTVAEAATLAAIVKSPTRYCPLVCPLSCQKRRNIVLQSMFNLGFIDGDQLQEQQSTPLILHVPEATMLAPHLKENIRMFLESLVGKDQLYTGGLVVKTTINCSLQSIAQQSFEQAIAKLRQEIVPTIDGGLITVDVKTGHIKALIGGFDFQASQFNRALQARRQMASIFKPIVYTAAIMQGFNFAHTEIDEPFALELSPGMVWRPQNYSGTFAGQMSLAKALSHSNNIITIKMLMHVGCQAVIDLAKKFRIQAPMQAYPSLALGCIDTTVKEVVGMFNVFANNGLYIEPHFIQWVKDRWGKKIYKCTPDREQIILPRVSGQVTKVLSIGMERALKRSNKKSMQFQAFGKTGTTNDARTNWFVGATPELTTAVYVGCDDNQSMGHVFAVSTAFPIWWNMHEHIRCTRNFDYDATLKQVFIDPHTGAVVDSWHPQALAILL